jgi:alkylation response protein AidB-like acyl-CoA dehydrogenase
MELTGEQQALRDAVRGLLTRHRRDAPARGDGQAQGDSQAQGDGPGSDPGYDWALWGRLCGEIGVAGLAVPECYGGAGAGPVETHIAAEELGRDLTPTPLLGSAVLAAQALLASGDAAACARLLPAIADGTTIAALAWTGPGGHWDPGDVACRADTAADSNGRGPDGDTGAGRGADGGTDAGPGRRPDGDWVLNGEAHYVLDGDTADVLLVAAGAPDGIGLFEADPQQAGITRSATTAMDGSRPLAVVRLENARGRRVGDRAALARARDLACIALSAEQVGAARRALELTVAYTKVRVQFGQAIGGFQALQHRMADLHVQVESARSLSYAVASAAADAAPDLGLRAAAAKVYCSEVALRVAGEMIQLHGAIGITWEHEAHRYLKRAHGAAQLFGPPSEHAARIAAALIDR